jgi:hypothetical protein
MSSKQGPRKAGMCASASAGGSLRSNRVSSGLLLARAAAGHRHTDGVANKIDNEVAA